MRMSRPIQAEVLSVLHIWGSRAMLRMKPRVLQLRCCSRDTRRWAWTPAGRRDGEEGETDRENGEVVQRAQTDREPIEVQVY